MQTLAFAPEIRRRNSGKKGTSVKNAWNEKKPRLINFPPSSRLHPSETLEKPDDRNKYWFFEMLSTMARATGREFNYNGSFHEAISSLLVVAQCLGMMPVIGVKSASAYGLRFTWKSFRTLYSIFALGFAISYTIFISYMTIKKAKQITFNLIVPIAFFCTTTFGVYSFIRVASKWPALMQHWEFVETILPPYQTTRKKNQLARKIKIVWIVVLSVALAEHMLNMASIIMAAIKSDPPRSALKDLFEIQIPIVFKLTELTWWKAIIFKWYNIIATFAWSFMDLFVMVISIGIASQFEQINADLQQAKAKHMPEGFWILRRIQYRKVVDPCESVDEAISQITLATFANNLFFVCVQIIRSVKPRPSFINKLYFWFSLIFLITRTFTTSLFASYVHDESRKPINVLRAIPRRSWCREAHRFAEEVVFSTVALTGMRFFFLTRTLILTASNYFAGTSEHRGFQKKVIEFILLILFCFLLSNSG